MSGETLQIARFVDRLTADDISDEVATQAKNCLVNYIACAIAGVGEEAVRRASTAFAPYAAPGNATVIGGTSTTDPISAAFLNCLSSTVLAFDETHARSVVHPVGPVTSALLAFTEERKVNGRDFLVALVAGIEVASRASLAVSVAPAEVMVGWSQSAICGGIGGAAAVARLMGLGETGISDALALGANASAGLRAMNGTQAVTIATSTAASQAYRAAVLAAAGMTASRDVFEHPFGFVEQFARKGHAGHLTNGLGQGFEVSSINFKPYPCGIVAHGSIDAAAKLRRSGEFGSSVITDVVVRLHPSCLALGDKPEATDAAEAMVSIQYWVATALLRDDLGTSCVGSTWIADEGRILLQKRVRLVADECLSRSAANLVVTLGSGQTLEAHIVNCLGSEGNPMKAADLDAKFRTAAAPLFPAETVDGVLAMCRGLEQVDDMSTLMRQLRRVS